MWCMPADKQDQLNMLLKNSLWKMWEILQENMSESRMQDGQVDQACVVHIEQWFGVTMLHFSS